MGDFASSLFDGRLFEQLSRMREAYQNIYYIIEGSPRYLQRWHGRARQLYAALVALTMRDDVRILWSDSEPTTAYLIATLAKKLQLGEKKGKAIVLHKKAKLETIRDWQLYILQAFPGVGPKLAEAILENLGSLEKFCTASITELSRIPGLGEKKAELIKRILMTPYSSGHKRRPYSLDSFLS